MAAHIPRLCGEDWQEWANKILAVHYGPTEYQQIPDHHRGDAGLEGFTRTDGHAYQAYGCEEPISTPDRRIANTIPSSPAMTLATHSAAICSL